MSSILAYISHMVVEGEMLVYKVTPIILTLFEIDTRQLATYTCLIAVDAFLARWAAKKSTASKLSGFITRPLRLNHRWMVVRQFYRLVSKSLGGSATFGCVHPRIDGGTAVLAVEEMYATNSIGTQGQTLVRHHMGTEWLLTIKSKVALTAYDQWNMMWSISTRRHELHNCTQIVLHYGVIHCIKCSRQIQAANNVHCPWSILP